jgi:branched-chain amino acid transport system ATP-binding protein
VLRVKDLTVAYGDLVAVREVSLAVKAGELVAVIGANGAGKTSLLRGILGLVPVRSGRVMMDGEDLTHLPPWERVRRGIGVVPEGRRVLSGLTVEENLRVGTFASGGLRDPKRLEEIYAMFPILAERRRQMAQSLSGGEQQMLAVARALISGPRLLLVDEVSAGLMPTAVRQVFALLEGLCRSGTTVLVAEQQARRVLEIADRAYVLEVGRVVLEGSGAELRNDPRVQAAYLGGHVGENERTNPRR